MPDNRDGGRGVGLNGEEECFGGDMGTHNVSTISPVGETGKKADPRHHDGNGQPGVFPVPQCEISVLS